MNDVPPQGKRADIELIRACQAGDTEAFRLLYRRHSPLVRGMLHHLCDPTTLDDLVQEVFVRAWKGIGTMKGQSKFSTWLYRIAWNVGSDYRRKMAKSRDRQRELTQSAATAATPNPLQAMHHQELVRRGLAQLKEEHATVIILHDLQDMSQANIAQLFDIPVGTVKSRLFHARATLRQFFQQEGVSL